MCVLCGLMRDTDHRPSTHRPSTAPCGGPNGAAQTSPLTNCPPPPASPLSHTTLQAVNGAVAAVGAPLEGRVVLQVAALGDVASEHLHGLLQWRDGNQRRRLSALRILGGGCRSP